MLRMSGRKKKQLIILFWNNNNLIVYTNNYFLIVVNAVYANSLNYLHSKFLLRAKFFVILRRNLFIGITTTKKLLLFFIVIPHSNKPKPITPAYIDTFAHIVRRSAHYSKEALLAKRCLCKYTVQKSMTLRIFSLPIWRLR